MSGSAAEVDRHRLGVLALVATAVLWGSNHVVARAVHEAVALPALVFWRWFLAATLLTLVSLPALRRDWPEIRQALPQLCVGGIVGVGIFSFLLLGGAYASPAVEVGIINATTPMWVALMALGFGTATVSARSLTGLALAFAGTVTVIGRGQPGDLLHLRLSLGNIWSLLGAICFAWFSIRARAWSARIAPLSLTIVTAWSGILLVMLPAYAVSIALGGPWLVGNSAMLPAALAAVAYMALAPTMLGNLFYLFGVSAVGPQRAAAYLYLSPVFSAALAIGWLGEVLAWFHAVGTLLILVGLWMGHSGARKA